MSSRIAALSFEQHGRKRLQPVKSWRFAAQDSVIPLVISEVAHAALSMPIAFVPEGEDYVPAAMLSPERARNLFVSRDGDWLGRHLPAALRAYPFRLGREEGTERLLLCVDEASGLLTEEAQGEPLFADDGKPTVLVQRIFDFLLKTEKDMGATKAACAVLQKHGLIVPWKMAVDTENGKREVQGFFCIDEAALNALPDADFLELRRSNALLLATCQLISMQNLSLLGELSASHAKAAAPASVQ